MIKNINLAYYKQEDWKRFIESIDDRKEMHDTWEEWHAAYMNTKLQLTLQGFTVNDCYVDIDKLNDFCRKEGIRNNGKARSKFVSNR